MALEKYSLTNLTNSLAEQLAAALLEAGYLLYWPTLDALQTPDGLYTEYQAQMAMVLQEDSAVAARHETSRGIITIRNDDFSFPQYPVRPTSDDAIASPEDMPIPSVVLHIQHAPNGPLTGLGSRMRWRYAALDLYGLARDRGEQLYLTDVLRVAFDESQFVVVSDHDAGTRELVGRVELLGTEVDNAIFPLGPESKVFEFTLNARLRYEA